MNEQDHIAIIDYLDGNMSPKQQAVFEKRLQEDAVLKTACDEMCVTLKGVTEYSRAAMKSSLVAIHTSLATANQFAKYNPSGGAAGGATVGSVIGKIFGLTIIVAIASVVLMYFDKFPIEHPFFDKVQEKVMIIDSLETSMQVETIYHEIYVPAGTLEEGQEGLIIYEDEIEGSFLEEYIDTVEVSNYE
ncbi:MAG: hypothetical protein ACPG4Z_00465 [Chitinophagales bacterium]